MAMNTLGPGVRWNHQEKAMVWTLEDEETDKRQSEGKGRGEVSTMNEFSKMASGILKCLNFTFDCPQMNENGAMAVLDTQMWVGEEERSAGVPVEMLMDKDLKVMKVGHLQQVVLYKFYQKSMTNKLNNMHSNTIPE